MVTAFLFMLVFSMSAQVLNEGDLLKDPSDLLDDVFLENGNGAYLQQFGNGNETELLQLQNGLEGNLAKILQSGDFNLALISQDGRSNQLALIQKGDLNLYELVNTGVGNQVVAIQQGNGNTIHQEIIQSNQIYSEMIQIGNDNEITTIIEGLNNRNFSIKQVGDGLKAVIIESGY